MNPLIQLQKTTLIFLVALACFGLSPMVQALLPPPPPDGGYPNETTAEGDGALFSLTDGVWNTALGFNALTSNTTGNFNTAVGTLALESNTTGDENTATGDGALLNNTTGFWNTATGSFALASNTTGSGNTATGLVALQNNTTGESNTATGVNALFNNTSGNDTRLLVLLRSLAIHPAAVTRPTMLPRCFIIRRRTQHSHRYRLPPRKVTPSTSWHHTLLTTTKWAHTSIIVRCWHRTSASSTNPPKPTPAFRGSNSSSRKITRNQVSLNGENANRHDNTIETVSGRVHVLDVPANKPQEVADLVSTTDGLIVHLAYAVPAKVCVGTQSRKAN
jgi:hypothetical protein